MKILAIKLRSLGDTVLLSGVLSALKESYEALGEKVIVDVAVPYEYSSLLNGHPAVRKVWRVHSFSSKIRKAFHILSLARKMRPEKYDYSICFHASYSSGFLSLVSGASLRSNHFHGHDQKNLFSNFDIPGKGLVKPAIERDLDAIRAIGVAVERIPGPWLPKVFLQPHEIKEAEESLLGYRLKHPILAITLGASRSTKEWPVENFARVATGWMEKEKGSVILFEGPNESQNVTKFRRLIASNGNTIYPVILKLLEIRRLASYLSKCSIYLGNDSGPKHLAVAVGTPTVTLFGPEDPFEWHPYNRSKHDFFYIEDLFCRTSTAPGTPPWCGVKSCAIDSVHAHRCMRKIEDSLVLQRCRELKRI